MIRIFSAITLAFTLSFDALGIGVSYRLKNVEISKKAKLTMFIVSFTVTTMALYLGKYLNKLIPGSFFKLISLVLLLLIASTTIIQSIPKKEKKKEKNYKNLFTKNKILNNLFSSVKTTKNTTAIDFDNSNSIDTKEAFYLALALSADSFAGAFSFSCSSLNILFFPLFSCLFQFIFLHLGFILANKAKFKFNHSTNVLSVISAIILFILAILKLHSFITQRG